MYNKFKEWLDAQNISPYEYSKTRGFALETCYKVYRGEKISRKTAKRIVRKSKKSLCLEDFGYVTKIKLNPILQENK